jgi:cysteine desulfurase
LDTGNPSSVHAEGRAARAVVEGAREEVAAAVSARAENVIFTSGATEAAALALTSRFLGGRRVVEAGRLYVGATEHPCVSAGGRFAENRVVRLPVSASGALNLAVLEAALLEHDHDAGAPYLALMLANNESGVIHPVADAAALVHAHGGYVFCDAAQALGRLPVDIGTLGVDFLALSAHKLGGPQGAGALVLADGELRPEPLLRGGGQERRRRAGTENVAAIAGFGVAAELARHHLHDIAKVGALRLKLELAIREVAADAVIFGEDAERVANTALFAVPGLESETAVIAFDLEGIALSAGSACSSGKMTKSHVIEAMGRPDLAACGIRASLPPDASVADIDGFAVAWRAIHARLAKSRAA